MNNNKKSFFVGVIFGMIALFVINSFITNANLIYRRFISKDLTIKQKASQIEYMLINIMLMNMIKNLWKKQCIEEW